MKIHYVNIEYQMTKTTEKKFLDHAEEGTQNGWEIISVCHRNGIEELLVIWKRVGFKDGKES